MSKILTAYIITIDVEVHSVELGFRKNVDFLSSAAMSSQFYISSCYNWVNNHKTVTGRMFGREKREEGVTSHTEAGAGISLRYPFQLKHHLCMEGE